MIAEKYEIINQLMKSKDKTNRILAFKRGKIVALIIF